MKFGFKSSTAFVFTLVMLCGCMFPFKRNNKKPNWDPASYSIDEIKKLAAKVNGLDNVKDDDCTDEAVKAYNVMLGYAENVAKFDYSVYDFYHVDFPDLKSYVIKLIRSDDAEVIMDDEKLLPNDSRIVMMTCHENGTDVQSEIEPKLMARRWIEELSASVENEHADFHVNAQYISIDHIVPHVSEEKYSDRSDYTYFFKDDFYKSGKNKIYDNIVNIIVPPDMPEESVRYAYMELESILKKYCVTAVNFYAPNDDETFDRLIDEEVPSSGNYYNFNDDDIKWYKTYKIEK